MATCNSEHTIILIQFEEDVRTRTYLHYETQKEAFDCCCNLYEQSLKGLDPNLKVATYDVSDLFSYLDKLKDISFLIFSVENKAYNPYGREWIKAKLFQHLKEQIGKS